MLQIILDLMNINQEEGIEIANMLIAYCLGIAKWLLISAVIFIGIALLLNILVVAPGSVKRKGGNLNG
ncbi:hypothetical protein [Gemella morbillorum]